MNEDGDKMGRKNFLKIGRLRKNMKKVKKKIGGEEETLMNCKER